MWLYLDVVVFVLLWVAIAAPHKPVVSKFAERTRSGEWRKWPTNNIPFSSGLAFFYFYIFAFGRAFLPPTVSDVRNCGTAMGSICVEPRLRNYRGVAFHDYQ